MCKSGRKQTVELAGYRSNRARTGVFDFEGGGDGAVPQCDAEGLWDQGNGRGNETSIPTERNTGASQDVTVTPREKHFCQCA